MNYEVDINKDYPVIEIEEKQELHFRVRDGVLQYLKDPDSWKGQWINFSAYIGVIDLEDDDKNVWLRFYTCNDEEKVVSIPLKWLEDHHKCGYLVEFLHKHGFTTIELKRRHHIMLQQFLNHVKPELRTSKLELLKHFTLTAEEKHRKYIQQSFTKLHIMNKEGDND